MTGLLKRTASKSQAFGNLRWAIAVGCLIATGALADSESRAAIVNGSFETGDFAGWYAHTQMSYQVGSYWRYDDVPANWFPKNLVVTNSYAGYSPTDGDYFAVLNLDIVGLREFSGPSPDVPWPPAGLMSILEQKINPGTGDTVSFDYAALKQSGTGQAGIPGVISPLPGTGVQWQHVEVPANPDPLTFLTFAFFTGSQTLLIDNVVLHPLTSEASPLLPTEVIPGDPGDPATFIFNQAPSGQWFDPPTASGFVYSMTSDSLFTEIMEFPSGFGPITLSVFGVPIGQFSPGDNFDFTLGGSYPGIKSFEISGLDPTVDPTDPSAFPLKLKFDTAYADFTMQAVLIPEPSTLILALCSAAGLALRGWRKRGQARPTISAQ
jgi:hypothetical protein